MYSYADRLRAVELYIPAWQAPQRVDARVYVDSTIEKLKAQPEYKAD